jgi:alpha-1,2-mannosyltransferase
MGLRGISAKVPTWAWRERAVHRAAKAGASGLTSLEVAPLVAIAALGFLVRLVPILLGGGLHGLIDYDDGVYFGAALALLQGHVAYRDFILLHPPGILYILAPFAALQFVVSDATAFAVARLGFMVLGAINVVLVGLVARRLGRGASLSAAALYAVWQVPANVERTTWLIAAQNTLLLLALLALSGWIARRGLDAGSPSLRQVAAVGALLGLATDVQIWGVVPTAVVLAWLTLSRRRPIRERVQVALAFTGAAAVAIALLWLPFLLAAGEPMIRYVVIDQIGRGAGHSDMVTRLRGLEGLPIGGPGIARATAALVGSAFVATAASIAFAAWRWRELRL